MCRKNFMQNINASLQRGFSLITAIFLLVVLSTLGTLMVTFFVAQQQSSALDIMGSRAYQAARAGVEWAAYNVAQTVPGGAVWAGCATYATPSQLFAVNTLAGNLAAFKVTLTCTSSLATEGATTINIYTLTSTAQNAG